MCSPASWLCHKSEGSHNHRKHMVPTFKMGTWSFASGADIWCTTPVTWNGIGVDRRRIAIHSTGSCMSANSGNRDVAAWTHAVWHLSLVQPALKPYAGGSSTLSTMSEISSGVSK